MSANANLVDLVRELDVNTLEAAMTILNDSRFSKEDARQACKKQFSHFGNECPHALIDIEHYIGLIDTIGNFQQDFFAKLMYLGTIYSDDEKIVAKLRQLWGLHNGYYLGMRVHNPALNSIAYDEALAKDVQRFLQSFEAYKPHVKRKIERTKGAEACDVTIIFLGDDDSSLSVEDQNKAKEQNIPLFIKKPGGWHVYGNVQGEWRERALDNLSEEENKALKRDPFTPQEIARIEVNKSKFPMALKSRLRKVHTFSTQITRNELETFIERTLNDLFIQSGKEELKLMNQTILFEINALIEKVKDVVKNDTLSFVDKLNMIYGLYRGYQEALQPHIRAFLYPDNQPSIEKLRIDVDGELQKTLGAYIRGKIAPEDTKHFTDEFIQQRLMASYLKMCMIYANSEVEASLKERFTKQYRELIHFALFQAAETSEPIEEDAFLKLVNSHYSKLKTIADPNSTLKHQSASLLKDVNDLLLDLKDHRLKDHRKLYREMSKLKEENIEILGEKIRCLQQIMDEAQVQFQPLVQRRKNIEGRWAEMQKLSQAEEAFTELERHIDPASLVQSAPVKESQKKGIFGFFPLLKKEATTQHHARSVPLVNTHVSTGSTEKAVSLPVSKQPAPKAIASSTLPPGLFPTPAASPSTILSPRPNLRIKVPTSSSGETVRVIDQNPTTSPGFSNDASRVETVRMIGRNPAKSLGSNGVSRLVDVELKFVPVEETATLPTDTPLHPPGLHAPTTSSSGPSMFRPLTPPADDIDQGTEIISEIDIDADTIPEIDMDAEIIPEIDIDLDSDTISEDLSNRGMRPR